MAGDVDRIGTASGVQVLVPTGPRDVSTVGSNLACTGGVHAIHWNPAGLARLENAAAGQFSTMTIFNDIKVNYFAVGANMGKLGYVAFSIKAFDFGDIPVTTREDMDGLTGSTFSPTFATTALTYANSLTSKIRVGINAKFIYESIPTASASAVAFDIGLQYDVVAGIQPLSFGIAIRNIGTSMRYEGSGMMSEYLNPATGRQDFLKREASKSDLPAAFDLGVSYKMMVQEQSNVILSTTFSNNNFGYDDIKLGVEYEFDNMIFLRGGYNYEMDASSDDRLYTFALGAGFNYQLGGVNLAIDYAFRNSQYFDANNLFGLTIGF
jgi:hypothetical protein